MGTSGRYVQIPCSGSFNQEERGLFPVRRKKMKAALRSGTDMGSGKRDASSKMAGSEGCPRSLIVARSLITPNRESLATVCTRLNGTSAWCDSTPVADASELLGDKLVLIVDIVDRCVT
jgi:hypothetical protein